jgi:hypothetical protein
VASDIPTPAASERIEQAPLDDLSHVELLERLALSLRRKRAQATVAEEASAANTEPAGAPAAVEPQVEAIAMTVEATPVEAKLSPPVPTIPSALRPVGLEDDEEADLLPAFVPPRHFAQLQTDANTNAAPPDAEAAKPPEPAPSKAETADELEEGYSSLLSLSRPCAGPQRFVRIEEPAPLSDEVEPVVVFPGKEPVAGEGPFARPANVTSQPVEDSPDAASDGHTESSAKRLDSEETDRALRTALANLQRMSGAA